MATTEGEAIEAPPAEVAPVGESLRDAFGLDDPELSDLKEVGVSCLTAPTVGTEPKKKRVKLTHDSFFNQDNGFKKILKSFPEIKLKGKGREFDDLAVVLQHYQKWFRELHPYGDNFEDLVYKARGLLSEKTKDDEGIISDPHAELHRLRFSYKEAQRFAADRAAGIMPELSDEMKEKIEANKRRALELKAKKSGAAGAAAASSSSAPAADGEEDPWAMLPPDEEAMDFPDEDVFGFGFGMDDEDDGPPPAPKHVATPQNAPPPQASAPAPAAPPAVSAEQLRRIAENRARAAALRQQRASAASTGSATMSTATATPPLAAAAGSHSASVAVASVAATAVDLDEEPDAFMGPPDEEFFEEEDVFGFGGGMDDDDKAPPPPPPPQTQQGAAVAATFAAPSAPKAMDPEVVRRIQENKAKAIAMKQERQAAEAHSQRGGEEAARAFAEATKDLADICTHGSANNIAAPASTMLDTQHADGASIVEDPMPTMPDSQPVCSVDQMTSREESAFVGQLPRARALAEEEDEAEEDDDILVCVEGEGP